MILSIGCGRSAAETKVIRPDLAPNVEPEVVWNLDQFPYPFAASIRRLANRFSPFYEQRFAWIFAAWLLSFEREKSK